MIAGSCVLKLKENGVKPSSFDQKYSKKFNKYLQRMKQIMEGTYKKIPNTPVF